MGRIFFLVVLAAMAMATNGLLMVNKEGILVSSKPSADGWKMTCTYYTPFELSTIEIPHYMHCDPRRQQDGGRKAAQFFWEHRT